MQDGSEQGAVSEKRSAAERRWEKVSGSPGDAYVVRPARTGGQVEERFRQHFAKWSLETSHVSNFGVIMSHPSYLAILGLGLEAVPYLLRELRPGGGGALIAALEAITGENPVAPEHEASSELMVADWMNWGRLHGIV